MKEKKLELIKKFSKIKIKNVCDCLKINKSNLWSGNCSEKNISDVLDIIIFNCNEFLKEYIKIYEESQNDKDDTL